MLYYFAYGSNLHPVRLLKRVPSAQLVGVVELRQHRLAFQKKSKDGSSKCNLAHTGKESNLVYGAIYELEPVHKVDLDRHEGKGHGYEDGEIALEFQGKQYECFTYFAQSSHIDNHLNPYHWYKNLVLLGAEYLRFPDAYIRSIEEIESVDDHDDLRRRQHESLIQEMLNYSRG